MAAKLGIVLDKTSKQSNKRIFDLLNKKQLGGNIANVAQEIAPFASNTINAFRRLPKVNKPKLQQQLTNPNLVDYSSDINETDRLLRAFDQGTKTANPATGNAIRAASLGKFLEQRNQLNQNQKNVNADILNRFQQFNAGIDEGNVNRLNEYKAAKTERGVAQQRLESENIANLSDKFQQRRRDKELMALESRKLDMLPALFKDNKVLERNLLDQMNEERKKFKLPDLGYTPDSPYTTPNPNMNGVDIDELLKLKKYGGKLSSRKMKSKLLC